MVFTTGLEQKHTEQGDLFLPYEQSTTIKASNHCCWSSRHLQEGLHLHTSKPWNI